MMDFSAVKAVTIPEGVVKKIACAGVTLWEAISFTNQVPISTDTDGSIYNGVGYKDGYRLSSSGGVSGTAVPTATHTGFIKFNAGEVIRVKITGGFTQSGAGNYFNFYDTAFGLVKADYPDSYKNGTYGTTETLSDGSTLITLHNYMGGLTIGQAYYIRISLNPAKGADLIVTVNEEIAG